jgi:hypothetical protein
MLLAVVLFAACQEDVDIPRRDKQEYIEALQSTKDLEPRVESDEASVIEKVTAILANPKITQVECRIRIQLLADKYTAPALFLPYQMRGKASLSLARKTSSAPAKKALLDDAIRDLKMSVGKGIDASKAPLDAAKKELEKLAADPGTPAKPAAPSIRPAWSQLVADRKFKSARALLDRDGGTLPESERTELASETDQACRAYLAEQMIRFRRNLAQVPTLSDLRAMTKSEFEITFALPPSSEIVVAYPPYDWARAHLPALQEAWANKGPASKLLPMAAAAADLDEGSENPWFRMAAALASQDARASVDKRVAESLDAPKAARESALAAAQAVLTSWQEFSARFRTRYPILEDHDRALAAAWEKRPRDLSDLEKGDLLGACLEGPDADAKLQALEQRLRAMESSGPATRESRQRLYSLLVAARSVRLFLSGKPTDEVVRAAREDLDKLSKVGGVPDPDLYGPRMRKVFDALR